LAIITERLCDEFYGWREYINGRAFEGGWKAPQTREEMLGWLVDELHMQATVLQDCLPEEAIDRLDAIESLTQVIRWFYRHGVVAGQLPWEMGR